jgi:hypothetical protein
MYWILNAYAIRQINRNANANHKISNREIVPWAEKGDKVEKKEK